VIELWRFEVELNGISLACSVTRRSQSSPWVLRGHTPDGRTHLECGMGWKTSNIIARARKIAEARALEISGLRLISEVSGAIQGPTERG
jgi:hypothetical protein